jgi:hypothetical protein
MYFTLRNDSKEWFKPIESQLEFGFDIYYFCLMAGLASVYKNDAPPPVTDLIDRFPGTYKNNGRLIIGLFLSTELSRMDVDYTDKRAVKGLLYNYIDSNSPIHLNDKGLKELNAYSHGGFERLQENFPDQPRKLETFLRLYTPIIKKLKIDNLGNTASQLI